MNAMDEKLLVFWARILFAALSLGPVGATPQATGYPEGKQELPADLAALMKVRIEAPAK